MTRQLEKPVLVLGIDGVLVTVNETQPPGAEQYREDDPRMFCYPDHALWLAPVLQKAQPYYLSAHCKNSDNFGRQIGLPWIPWLDYSEFVPEKGDDFVQTIDQNLKGRPLAWIDNMNHTHDRAAWAAVRNRDEAPTLLIKPAGERGLQREHVDEVLSWLGRLATAQKP